MKVARILVGVALAAILLWPVSVRGEAPAEVFARGKELLAKGDFQGALTAYAAAARADQGNRDYLRQYMLVRQVIEIRNRLEMEKDPRRWEYLARALHSYYVSQGLYDETVALDRRIHARLQSASSAVMLAETQLAMNQNAEAAETLSALESGKATPSTRALLGIALARDGKLGAARRIADTIALPQKAGPGMTYRVARLQAATGNSATALDLLARCFESVAPSRLDDFKLHSKKCPEFADLAASSDFARVLQTKSKVPESKCSGGSRCAGCPMRGKCGKNSTE